MPMMGDMSAMNGMNNMSSMNEMNDSGDMASMPTSVTSYSSFDKPLSASNKHQHFDQDLHAAQKPITIQQADTMSPSDMMGVACGYCVLLMHLPLLVLLAVVVISSLLGVIRLAFPRLIFCLVLSPTLTDSQPRAPPLSAGFALRTAA